MKSNFWINFVKMFNCEGWKTKEEFRKSCIIVNEKNEFTSLKRRWCYQIRDLRVKENRKMYDRMRNLAIKYNLYYKK